MLATNTIDAIKTVVGNALNLEINTIIKKEMSGCKMPSNRREAFWDIATAYHYKLVELECREAMHSWDSAGILSFWELRQCAAREMKAILKRREEGKALANDDENLSMLGRIKTQSEQLVSIFSNLAVRELQKTNATTSFSREAFAQQAEQFVKEYIDKHSVNIQDMDMENLEEDARFAFAQTSEVWNNDITRERMQNVPDLDLDTAQLTTIRKIWEIGTEEILMQTVIQIDGDVTTRIAERLMQDNKTIEYQRALVFKLHDQAVSTSVNFWANLIKTISSIGLALLGKNIN